MGYKDEAMRRLIFGVVLAVACWGQAQTPPAAYQPIRVKFRVLDLDGRPLEGATISAHLDTVSTRVPPDKVLKGKSGADEFTYTLGEQMSPIFSTQQQVGTEGFCEVPFIVYSNRSDAIDYELDGLYKQPNKQVLVSADIHQSFTNGDDNRLIILHANVRREFMISSLLVALAAFLGVTLMGFLLFFRGVYPFLLSRGWSIDASRAVCWAGTSLICLAALMGFYWWLLPHYINVWVVLAFLLAIWILHVLVSMLTHRRVAY
jgi:hypothetical protein